MIKAIDATQGGPPPESSGVVDPEQRRRAELAAVVEPLGFIEPAVTPTDIPLLTLEEKRRILARIARVNALDCFDESGTFDIARAKKVLPPGSIHHIAVNETTRDDSEGQPITQRRINVRLVDPLSALRLDDQMERRRERTTSSSSSRSESQSDSDSTPPSPQSPEYGPYLLRIKTRGLNEANRTLAALKKALAEAQDEDRRVSKELDEINHQLEQRCPVPQGHEKPANPSPETLGEVEGKTQSSVKGKTPNPSSTALQSHEKSPKLKNLSNAEGGRPLYQIGEVPNSTGSGAFASCNQATSLEPSNHCGSPRSPPKAA